MIKASQVGDNFLYFQDLMYDSAVLMGGEIRSWSL